MNKLPLDVELIIYRYVHEMNMINVLKEIVEQNTCLENIMKYFKKSAFYPYTIAKRLVKSNKSIFYKNKIQKYVHYRLLQKVIKSFCI